MNAEFEQLDFRVKKWVYKQGWNDLRNIQKKAIAPILSGKNDVVISASTASGKTEAFFLPACSAVAEVEGFGIIYVSPLKALINDQNRRLEALCELLDIGLTPWHGDSPQSAKRKAKLNPSGVLLITPESLESLLIREPGWLKHAFSHLKYVVIDEFHAFIGSERGIHLLSLLNRLDHLMDRNDSPVPRIALSATLGELQGISRLLRPGGQLPCTVITDDDNQSNLKMQLKGYVEQIDYSSGEIKSSAEEQVCNDIYRFCRGSSNLVFANSRKRTEGVAASLKDRCEENIVPNEFFPHHGSLSKELRESLELRLQAGNLPTTAICTMTLELGIDIGKVDSVIQVTAPHSVASLRQRLGRSGRRGDPAILRLLITERAFEDATGLVDTLRLELLQAIAMVRLLLRQWYEPAETSQYHFSVLLHQVLAVTAQWGGVRADQLYFLLCQTGPFGNVTIGHFKQLLTHMGQVELLTQLSSGELVLGVAGEKLTDHYTFYAVFQTPEEYRLIAGGKTLGTLPLDSMILAGQHIVFGGWRWKVLEVNSEKKIVYVEKTKTGKPPKFGGEGMVVHDAVRQEMFRIYCEGDYRLTANGNSIDFLDSAARELFLEGLSTFRSQSLEQQWIVQSGANAYIISWTGDKLVKTLVALLNYADFKANSFAGVIELQKTTVGEVIKHLKSLNSGDVPTETDLALMVQDKFTDKFDEWLPEDLLVEGYARKVFDISKALSWINSKLV